MRIHTWFIFDTVMFSVISNYWYFYVNDAFCMYTSETLYNYLMHKKAVLTYLNYWLFETIIMRKSQECLFIWEQGECCNPSFNPDCVTAKALSKSFLYALSVYSCHISEAVICPWIGILWNKSNVQNPRARAHILCVYFKDVVNFPSRLSNPD